MAEESSYINHINRRYSANLLDELPKKRWVDLHIAKKVNKDEVLTKGETIADDISALFEILMPLYEASTAHAT